MVARVYVDPKEQSDSEGRQLGGQAGKQRKGKKQKQVGRKGGRRRNCSLWAFFWCAHGEAAGACTIGRGTALA